MWGGEVDVIGVEFCRKQKALELVKPDTSRSVASAHGHFYLNVGALLGDALERFFFCELGDEEVEVL